MANTINSIDSIKKQARQGSIAAIIQILNDQLADQGIRTRAILAEGVLHLLCEAAKLEQLEKSALVQHIQGILASLAPRNIRRVQINSRLVREQQLLWLEEINRDPENQLLWSEEIVLPRPNILKIVQQYFQDWQPQLNSNRSSKERLPSVGGSKRKAQRSFRRGLLGGVTLTSLIMVTGWIFYGRQTQKNTAQQSAPLSTTAMLSSTNSTDSTNDISTSKSEDPFAQAVTLAEKASAEGKTAKTSPEWSKLADQWQQASDLMAAVPADDPRYVTAQDRVGLYQQNSEVAREKAK